MSRLAVAVLVALLAGALATVDQSSRPLLQVPPSCNNTASGRWYVTDNRGLLCARDALDYTTGCCTTGQLHSCDTCKAEDKCCSQYEHCVSCCLKPDNHPEQHMRSIYRGRNKPETGHWGSEFEYCQAVCRTTARSTQHENAFILDRRYCFSKLGRPHVPVPPAPPLPKSISLVAGSAGQACDATCAAKNMACKAEHFSSLNNCNSLRAKFMCEAGCSDAAANQGEFPGYVEGSAPKHQRPAYCATLPPFPSQPAPSFNCSHAAGSVRRLCPCEPLSAAAVAAAQMASAAAGAAGKQAGAAGAGAEGGAQAGAATEQAGAAVAADPQQAAAAQAAAAQAQAQQAAIAVQQQVDEAAAAAMEAEQAAAEAALPQEQQPKQQAQEGAAQAQPQGVLQVGQEQAGRAAGAQ